ncbi:unnamed protein product [Rhodiola kirilowii]
MQTLLALERHSKRQAEEMEAAGGSHQYKRGLWTEEEDKILMEYVEVHGKGQWNRIAKNTGLKRCGKSCRLRWVNYLSPNVKRGNFTEEEDDLIIRLHKLLGNRWSLIAGRVPGRTDNQVKNYWNTHLSKRNGCTKRQRTQSYIIPNPETNYETLLVLSWRMAQAAQSGRPIGAADEYLSEPYAAPYSGQDISQVARNRQMSNTEYSDLLNIQSIVLSLSNEADNPPMVSVDQSTCKEMAHQIVNELSNIKQSALPTRNVLDSSKSRQNSNSDQKTKSDRSMALVVFNENNEDGRQVVADCYEVKPTMPLAAIEPSCELEKDLLMHGSPLINGEKEDEEYEVNNDSGDENGNLLLGDHIGLVHESSPIISILQRTRHRKNYLNEPQRTALRRLGRQHVLVGCWRLTFPLRALWCGEGGAQRVLRSEDLDDLISRAQRSEGRGDLVSRACVAVGCSSRRRWDAWAGSTFPLRALWRGEGGAQRVLRSEGVDDLISRAQRSEGRGDLVSRACVAIGCSSRRRWDAWDKDNTERLEITDVSDPSGRSLSIANSLGHLQRIYFGGAAVAFLLTWRSCCNNFGCSGVISRDAAAVPGKTPSRFRLTKVTVDTYVKSVAKLLVVQQGVVSNSTRHACEIFAIEGSLCSARATYKGALQTSKGLERHGELVAQSIEGAEAKLRALHDEAKGIRHQQSRQVEVIAAAESNVGALQRKLDELRTIRTSSDDLV